MLVKETKPKSVWDGKIVRQALIDALVKLNPRTMMRNPVMFVVEVGSVITSVLLFKDLARTQRGLCFRSPDYAVAVVHRAFRKLC